MIMNFSATPAETALLEKILARAKKELDLRDPTSTEMDLIACNRYDTPLDFQKLLDAPQGDFGHDIYGISRYIDRKTGKLTGSFAPRCGAPTPIPTT